MDPDKVLSSVLCPWGRCGLHGRTTAPPERRVARTAKQTLGRAQISWTGWWALARRSAQLWRGTGCAVRRAHPGHPPALGPRRSCRRSARAAASRVPGNGRNPGPGLKSSPCRGHGAESPTCHLRRPTWASWGGGRGLKGREKAEAAREAD